MRRAACSVRGWTRVAASLIGLLAVFAAAPRGLAAQERGANALGEAIEGLGVSARVLMIGAHPDDEDTFLITWLQRGRHVETAYLSLTRGDGGQNLIGNELGEALGVIRTEELLAARRIDGARQYFTRAFDFGFSKDTIDTYKHWQRDSILGDVVRVVRAFRPHVIVAVFSGTPRDGHGHHQVSGLLARAAYDLSGDAARFSTKDYGPAWTALKFYRVARFNPQGATLGMDVGEYSPLIGRSYGEIAGESRSQHKSQGFGVLQRKGSIIDYVRREGSRMNEAVAANTEKSMFDGIDTTWSRFQRLRASYPVLDSIPTQLRAVRAAFDPFAPEKLMGPLAAVRRSLETLCGGDWECHGWTSDNDLNAVVGAGLQRVERAMQLAAGIEVEANLERELVSLGRGSRGVVAVYNRGRQPATIGSLGVHSGAFLTVQRAIPAGGAIQDTVSLRANVRDEPLWLMAGRFGDMFATRPPDEPLREPWVFHWVTVDGHAIMIRTRFTYRYADAVKGERTLAAARAPTIAISLEQRVQYTRATTDVEHDVVVRLRAADDSARDVRVTLTLPSGLRADSVSRTVAVSGYDVPVAVTFHVRGKLTPGEHRIEVVAEYRGERFAVGYELIDYDHIRRQRIYRPASMQLSAVDVRVPGTLRVAYITGVGDNVAPALTQLGIPTTVIAAGDVARADLTPYTTVVVGPRAYEAHPELIAANPKLFNFARKGGVLLVQYGQYEMTQPSAMPYPITLARPADRVTEEDAVVTIDAPNARELTAPNRIGPPDFDGWVQERSLYMPRTFDEHYRALMSINDTGEPANKGGVLIAPLGDGLYIYTTLSFFRQLPAGVPGGARLFVNLLSAKLTPPPVTP